MAKVARFATAVVIFTASAHATEAVSAPESANDATKIDRAPPAKAPLIGKVKECCGYPVAGKEGFRLSFYWLAYEAEYANEEYDTAIFTRQGFFIGRYPQAFVYELKLEGSGVLRDGRVLNYDGECNYGIGTCFRALEPSEHPLGAGAQGRRLDPFRSIAVDPKYIPLGSPVYVPELVGVTMPDGTLHDGCLRADDVGSAIKQHKLDFFVESYFNFKAIGENLWWRLKATPHLDEPRCEYLRVDAARDRVTERADWIELHKHKTPSRQAKAALKKLARQRAQAQAWLKHHYAKHGGHSAVAHKK